MFSKLEIENYYQSLNLPAAAREFIDETRNSEPSRSTTEGCFRNSSSLIFSDTMEHTIQSESSTGEYDAVYEYAFDANAKEFWDQLPPRKVKGINKNGKNASWTIRADFLILYKSGPEIHEIKADSSINKKIKENDPNWTVDNDGTVHYLPAEKYFADLGICYRVRPISKFNKILLSNIKIILLTRRREPVNNKLKQKAMSLLDGQFSVSLSSLKQQLGITDITPLIQLIDTSVLHCELDTEFLSDPENIYVSLTKALSKQSKIMRENSKRTIDFSKIEVVGVPSKRQAEIALERLQKLESGLDTSTTRKWRKKIIEGEKNGISPFTSLIPNTQARGNRSPRISKNMMEVISESIEKYYANEKRPNMKSAFNRYRKNAMTKMQHCDPVSEKTFRKIVKQMDPMKIGYQQGGKRMMNANSPTSEVNDRKLKSRIPFERAHLDHHLVKCFVRWGSDADTMYVGRPWLTMLIDEATARPLGYRFSFQSPSRLADGSVLRDCVRKFGKLPNEIVVDHGPDFKSVYFRSLLASYKITTTFRPKSFSKGGSEIERTFNEFQTQWLSQRPGNMVDKYAARSVDGAFAASKHAVLRPEDLLMEFETYLNHRQSILRGNDSISINNQFDSDLETFGFTGVKVDYDTKFLVATAAEIKEYTIERNDVKIDGIRYSSPELRYSNIKKTKVEIRIEPENPYIVYAFVKNRWITCMGTGAIEFQQKTWLNQQVETMKLRGVGSLKDVAKEKGNDELAALLAQADENLQKVSAENSDDEGNKTDTVINNLFETMSDENKILETENWEI